MKVMAYIMVALLVVALAGVGYLYSTAGVDVNVAAIAADSCGTLPDTFSRFRTAQESDSVVGTVFSRNKMGNAEGYNFVTYSVSVSNHSFLPVQSIFVQIIPESGDVLQIGNFADRSLENGQSTNCDATMISAAGIDYSRELKVTYYIFGLPMTKTVQAIVTYG